MIAQLQFARDFLVHQLIEQLFLWRQQNEPQSINPSYQKRHRKCDCGATECCVKMQRSYECLILRYLKLKGETVSSYSTMDVISIMW
jgi:hypothetical protein